MKTITIGGTKNTGSKRNVMLDTLTGDEFKTLIEQITQDGKINTVPELMAFVGNIPEGTTLLDYIQAHSVDPEAVDKAVDNAFEEKNVMTGGDRVTAEELEEFEV